MIGKPMIVICCSVPVAFMLLVGYGCSTASVETAVGVVIERAYRPDTSTVNVGISTSGNPVVTPSGSPEGWLAVVDINGDVVAIDVGKTYWLQLKPGVKINLHRRTMKWFGKGNWHATKGTDAN